MNKQTNHFVKLIKDLNDYDILIEKPDYLLVGTTINVVLYKEMKGNVFSFYTKNTPKKLYVCFFITSQESINLPYENIEVLLLDENDNIDKIEKKLKGFIDERFKEE